MDIGTAVIASREGVVVETKEDSNIGGVSSYYDDYANKVIIMHDDGTFGVYAHLKQNGVEVLYPDKKPFMEKVKTLYDEYKEDPEIYSLIERIQAAQEEE